MTSKPGGRASLPVVIVSDLMLMATSPVKIDKDFFFIQQMLHHNQVDLFEVN